MMCDENYETSFLQKTLKITMSAIITVLQPLIVWVADNVTDVLFFITYAKLMSDPILLTIEKADKIDHSILPEIQYFLIVIGAVMSLSTLAFLASLFSCTSYIPRVLFRPLAVQLMMNDPDMVDSLDQRIFCDVFRRCWLWQPGDIATSLAYQKQEQNQLDNS